MEASRARGEDSQVSGGSTATLSRVRKAGYTQQADGVGDPPTLPKSLAADTIRAGPGRSSGHHSAHVPACLHPEPTDCVLRGPVGVHHDRSIAEPHTDDPDPVRQCHGPRHLVSRILRARPDHTSAVTVGRIDRVPAGQHGRRSRNLGRVPGPVNRPDRGNPDLPNGPVRRGIPAPPDTAFEPLDPSRVRGLEFMHGNPLPAHGQGPLMARGDTLGLQPPPRCKVRRSCVTSPLQVGRMAPSARRRAGVLTPVLRAVQQRLHRREPEVLERSPPTPSARGPQAGPSSKRSARRTRIRGLPDERGP